MCQLVFIYISFWKIPAVIHFKSMKGLCRTTTKNFIMLVTNKDKDKSAFEFIEVINVFDFLNFLQQLTMDELQNQR